MRRQLPVARLQAGLWCCSRWQCTLFAAGGVRMFLWVQRPWKHQCGGPAQNNCLVPGFLINVKGGWGTIPAVLSGANRGRQGTLNLSRCPISGSPCYMAVIHTAGLMWLVFLFTYVCMSVCACAHRWDGVYPIIKNISSTALNCWLDWPCICNPFVLPTTSEKHLPSRCISQLNLLMM